MPVQLGVVSGVQVRFRSSVITIAELMGFKDPSAGQFKLRQVTAGKSRSM